MLILVLLLSSICICLADFKAEVEEGPGTFLNTVPDGWFKNGEEGEAAGKIFFDILKYKTILHLFLIVLPFYLVSIYHSIYRNQRC